MNGWGIERLEELGEPSTHERYPSSTSMFYGVLRGR